MCEWEITVDAKHTVLLHVADLNIQPHDCQITYLRIYNGIGPHRSELGETRTHEHTHARTRAHTRVCVHAKD